MIVNLTDDGWEIIYHRAHALLAAQIAGYWDTPDDTSRLVDTIAAIAHHDDLEREWQGDHLTKAGAPLDFTLGGEDFSVAPLYEHIENALYRGRWVALLVSMHMSFLSEGKRGEMPELDEFLDKQIELRQTWRESLGISEADAETAYAKMQCCDRLSLILCQQQIPDGERWLEIAKGPTGEQHDIIQRGDKTLTVKPWPFKDEKFTVRVDASYLTQMKFQSDKELVESLKHAPISSIEWTFVA
ncbi:MAG: DUF3891 family protein [Chamaesiphon sp.]|nr:DUF3891 family protein [Chamaesiphon sp.]